MPATESSSLPGSSSQGNGVTIPPAPKGWATVKWLGPSFLWMLSAAGSGELLFTPRIASLYGYGLLWALLVAVALKWFINREVGRYTVCTGATVLQGFNQIKGPKSWAVWVILVPQLLVAVTMVAGLAGAAATALTLVISGSLRLLTLVIVLVTAAVIWLGQYRKIEKMASILAIILSVAVLTAAFSVFPAAGELTAGLRPQLPEQVNYAEVLPWLGFMLSGAAGMLWYSYWLQARGYGATALKSEQPLQLTDLEESQRKELRSWIKQMTFSITLAVVGAILIALAFLILGGELLRPKGITPEENKIAETLARLLGDVWGPTGFWFMVGSIFITFVSTILSDQDGYGRLFSDGTRLILIGLDKQGRWTDPKRLRRLYLALVLTILPILLYLLAGNPVTLLQVAGAIEAAHIPLVAGLILYLNRKLLPPQLRPGKFTFVLTALAGLFFAVFAVVHGWQLLTGS